LDTNAARKKLGGVISFCLIEREGGWGKIGRSKGVSDKPYFGRKGRASSGVFLEFLRLEEKGNLEKGILVTLQHNPMRGFVKNKGRQTRLVLLGNYSRA